MYSVDAPLTDKSLKLGARESQRIAIPHNTYLENNAIDGFAERMEGGLGSVLTTRQTRFEKEIKQLLSIPDDVTTMALLPIGFPADGTRYGPTRRKPLEEVAFVERWGESWQLGSPGYTSNI